MAGRVLVSELAQISGYADPVRWLKKPDDEQIGIIVNRIPRHYCELSIGEWADVFERGQTVLPAKLSAPHKSGDFLEEQQMFPVDIDHDTNALSPSKTVNKYREHGIFPAILYHSMSSTLHAPRYRVVIVTDKPAVGVEQIAKVYSALLYLTTPEPDPSSGDKARMFFGASSTFPLPVRRLWEFADGDGEAPTVEQLIAMAPSPGESGDEVFASRAGNRSGRRRKPADEYLIAHADLLEYVRQITGERGVRRGNTVNFHKCPICNHFNHFVVSPNPHGVDLWTCFGKDTAYKDAKGAIRHPGGTIVDLIAYTKKGVR
jgi:hypothetical protein